MTAAAMTAKKKSAVQESGVRVGKSEIAGMGLFATRDFAKGSLVGEFEYCTAKRQSAHVLTLDDGKMLLITNDFKRLNHSSRPNLIVTETLGLVAKKKISAGDELTIHYGPEFVKSLKL